MTIPASPGINAFLTGVGLHLSVAGQAYALGNASTTDEIGLCNLIIKAADTAGNLAGLIYPAGEITVELTNGSNQTITAAVLEMASTDAGASHPSIINYSPVSFSNIAAAGVGTLVFALNQGVKEYAILKLTYGSAPTSGQVTGIVDILPMSSVENVALNGSNVEQAPGSPIPEHGILTGGEDPSGDFQAFQQDADKNVEVTAANAIWIHDFTVPAGKTAYISSGNELAVGNLTINGTLINYGVIRCQSCSFGVSGAYVAGVGSTFEVNSIF